MADPTFQIDDEERAAPELARQRAQGVPPAQEPRISGQAALDGISWLEANDATLPDDDEDDRDDVDKSWVGNVVSAITRGAGQAVVETADLAARGLEISARITGDEEFLSWYGKERNRVKERALGLLPEHEGGGVYNTVESLAQFGVGMFGAGKVLAPLRIAGRAKQALGLGTKAAKGVELGTRAAATDFAAFNPELDRLSNTIEDGPDWMTNPLTRYLAQDEDDPELLSRSKAAMEGVLLGSTIGAVLGGARMLRLRKADKAGRLKAGELDKELRKIEKDVEIPQDRPARVVQGEDGIRVELDGSDVTKQFDSVGQAESHAASINFAHRIRSLPIDQITEESKAAFRRAAKAGGKSLDDMQLALDDVRAEYNVTGGWESFSKSVTSVVDQYKPLAALRKTDKRGIVQSHKETERLADNIMKGASRADAEAWARSLVGSTENLPETMLAIRKLQETQTEHIAKLSAAVDLDPSNSVNVNELRRALDSFLDVQSNLSETGTGVGRSLEALKVPSTTQTGTAGEGVESVLRTARKANTPGSALDGMTEREILNLARTFRLSVDASGRVDPNRVLSAMSFAKEIQDKIDVPTFGWQKYRDLLIRYRTNAMLSGPRTHVLNAVSNLVTAFQIPLETWFAGARTRNPELAREGLDLVWKAADLSEALGAARRTWKLRQGTLDPRSKFDVQNLSVRHGGDLGWFERLTSVPGRAMMSTDEFFKSMSSRSRIRADASRLARRDAERLGLTGDEYSRMVTSRVEDAIDGAFDRLSPEQLRQLNLDEGLRVQGALSQNNPMAGRALEHARRATFQQDLQPGTLGALVEDAARKWPTLRLVVPFIRTPTNLLRFAHQRTPGLNRLQREFREELAAGGERAAVAKAKSEVGGVMYGSFALLALGGMVTGRGPSDPILARQWRQNNQPYSIKLPGGRQISYERFQPLFTGLGL